MFALALAAALLAGVVANQRRRRYWGCSERSLGLDWAFACPMARLRLGSPV